MKDIEIRRPCVDDMKELHDFFTIVINDTFRKEGLSDLKEEIENEITVKKKYLKLDIDSNGNDRYFLIAVLNKEIIGTIEFGPANHVIKKHTNGALDNIVEVGTVFVRPDYQNQGVGRRLLNQMFFILKDIGLDSFCLDSGYTHAQKIWKRKFGNPTYLLKDFWGPGFDHMIWVIQLKDIKI